MLEDGDVVTEYASEEPMPQVNEIIRLRQRGNDEDFEVLKIREFAISGHPIIILVVKLSEQSLKANID
jgi:hypothetical protein